MEHVRLGRSGLQVSRLCLGTMTFGLQSDEATGLGGLGVGELDPPAAAPMMIRTNRPTDTPETDKILPRWVCGLPHAN